MKLLCLLLISTLALHAQAQKKKKGANNPEGPQIVNLGEAKLAGEISGERVSDPEKQSDWPAVAAASDGSFYAIYVLWNDKDADSIVVRRKDPSGKWEAPMSVCLWTAVKAVGHMIRPVRQRAVNAWRRVRTSFPNTSFV